MNESCCIWYGEGADAGVCRVLVLLRKRCTIVKFTDISIPLIEMPNELARVVCVELLEPSVLFVSSGH